ncbi:non-ribosomal peptide synthetase [Rhodococcoides corynebacterioides]|uniref:non-ribosomal peptide synthetase n=1 Tax=Rhodococcoides corynebacterioides TaxID=53972 RepID=UPI0009329CEE|nr:non-ribosomal peptide synthetase [Rhodococcus corynebacterioides]
MTPRDLTAVVARTARLFPDAPVFSDRPDGLRFDALAATATGLRAAVPAFAAAPDGAIVAAVTASAPADAARHGTDLPDVVRASAAREGTVVAALRRVVRHHPDRLAVRDGSVALTYADLWTRATDRAATVPREPVVAPAAEGVDAAVDAVAALVAGACLVAGGPADLVRPGDTAAARVVLAVADDDDGAFLFDDAALVAGCRSVWGDVDGPVLWWHAADRVWGPLEFWGALLLGLGLVVADRSVPAAEQIARDGVRTVAATVHQRPDLDTCDAVVLTDGPASATDRLRPIVTAPGVFGAASAEALVLDRRLRRVPAGVVGDLYVPGDAVASSAASTASASLTALRLVAAAGGDRVLRTGVRATVDRSGAVSVVGDGGALRRGVRVSVADTANRVRELDGVTDAHVVLRDDPASGPVLVAYLRSAGTQPDDALRAAARDGLPDYARPDVTVVLPSMPLGPDGRVDEARLPEVDVGLSPTADDVPDARSTTVDLVQSVFADLLGTPTVGYDSSFFDLGGSSLVATKAVARLNAAGLGRLRVADIFDAPTPRTLAHRLDAARNRDASEDSDASDAALPRFDDIVGTPRPQRLPLAPAQVRLWVLARLDPTSSAYTVPLVLRLSGELDVAALGDSLTDLAARHESLRARFPEDDDGPYVDVLEVDDVVDGAAPLLRPRAVSPDAVTEEITRVVAEPVDVTREPPYRTALLRVSPTEHVLVVCLHHLVVDGESLPPLVTDLVTAYAARSRGAAPVWADRPAAYTDYARWQRALLGTPDAPTPYATAQLQHWDRALDGLPDSLTLPVDRLPSERPGAPVAGEVRAALPADRHRELDAFARRFGVSEHMVLLAAHAVGIGRWAGVSDLAVGVATAGRTDPALTTVVGMFVGTVAVRVRVDPSDSFADVVRRVRDTTLAAYDAADVPFDWVAGRLGRTDSPLYRVGFAYRAASSAVDVALPGLRVSVVDADVLAPKDDVLLTAEAATDEAGRPAGIALSMVYSAAVFDAPTVASALSVVQRVLEEGIARPETSVADLDVLGPDGRRRLIASLRGAMAVGTGVLPDLLIDAAARHADRPAVTDGAVTLTYRELADRATRLARTLIAQGAGPETVVAVSFPRSVEMVVAVWAVAASGAAYLPLDASYPAARLAFMVADSGVRLGLCSAERRAGLPDAVDWTAFDIGSGSDPVSAAEPAPVTDAERRGTVRPDSAAYVIYTSGSTGTPKGVVVTHAGLSGLAAETRIRFATRVGSRPAQTASPSFDPYVMDMLLFALGGAVLVVVPPDVVGGDEMTDLLAAQRVTHLSTTPGLLATLDPDRLPTLEMVSVGGEPLSPGVRDAWAPRLRLVNAYGPTEATVASHFSEPVRPGATVTVGRAITGMGAAILDERLQPVPLGSVGELYLLGRGLARGYHGRPGLTATRFVPNPFDGSGSRLYRTGDLVRAVVATDDAAPVLRYVGRADTQVKVRGIRVEPSEVDAVLVQRHGVDAAVTVPRTTPAGDTVLVSYVVQRGERTPDHLRTLLAADLPAALVPSAVVVLDRLPLTPNGKIDTAALPAPDSTPAQPIQGRAASSDAERAVLAAFAAVTTGVELGADDDFFRHGGDSLGATRVASRLGREFGRRVPVRAVFDRPTAAALAAYLTDPATDPESGSAVENAGAGAVLAPGSLPRPDRPPLSYAQARMWFANRFDTTGSSSTGPATAYNVPLVTRMSGPVDVAALAAAVRDVVARHEVLRTRYPDSDDGPFQEVLPPESVPVALEPVPVTDDPTSAVAAFVGTRFDVTAAPPVAVRLWRLGARDSADPAAADTATGTEYLFALVVHHVALDGESMQPLVRDLLQAYAARVAGTAPAFAPLPVQYADVAVWQRARLGDDADPGSEAAAHVRFWRDALAGAPESPILPTDRPRPPVASLRAATVPVVFDAETTGGVQRVAAATGATPFMVVHAALAVFLARWSRENDIVIGTPVAGRGDALLDDVVGMFVGTVVLRTRVDGRRSFEDVVRAVRSADLDAFGHADLPFERVVDALDPVRSTAHHPVFQIMLSYQNLTRPSAVVEGVEIAPLDVDPKTSQYDLHLVVADGAENAGAADGMAAALTYATDLFDEATARAWARSLPILLAALVADPARPVGDAPLMEPAEEAALLAVGAPSAAPPLTLTDLLTASYRAHADRVAVVDGDTELTYAALGERVRARRDRLIADGVGPESVVAVRAERSVDFLVEVQAIVSAGAAYLPVDPSWPEDRRARVRAAERRCGAGASVAPGHPAYVLFTSGSTGAPKGVVVPQGAVASQLLWLHSAVPSVPEAVMLWRTRVTFDLSVWELWWPMIGGATLVVGPPDCDRDPAILADTLRRHRVTTVTFVPSPLASFLAHDPSGVADAMGSVRDILCIGEALPAALVDAVRATTGPNGPTVHNLYGPTEATVSVTHHRVSAGR